MKYIFFLHAFFVLLLSCNSPKETRSDLNKLDTTRVALKYAQGFSITKRDGYKIIEVTKPFQGASKGYQYLLVPKDRDIPEHPAEMRVIRTPVSSIVCTSTTHIPLLDYLNETDKLVGFPTTDYISSQKARKLIDENKIKDLGIDKGMNLEQLMVLKPALVMGYTMSADFGQFHKVEQMGIPVILNAEYLETHPLGRAEWIKFMAALFNKEREADSVFLAIEKNYTETASLVAGVDTRPTVLSGIMYGDAWFLPGGKNYASRILDDAGCQYLWRSDSSSGFLELSFEHVFQKAHDAELWIGIGPYSTLKEMSAGNHRYTQFKAYQNRNVYGYDARKGAKGGNEFLELGYLRPDLILKDLVKIAHPELLPGHSLYFHRKVE